ncbi:mitotubule-associated protein Gb4, partial [Trypanosoma theileri]
VTAVDLDPAPRALIAFVTVRHTPQLKAEKVMDTLKQCEYKAVWALYEERPHDSSELTKKFEGDDWDLVVENNREKLERAFRKETADALGVSPSQVVVTNCRIGSLFVDFKVMRCGLSDEEILKRT